MRIFSTTHDTVYKVEIMLLPIVKSGGQKVLRLPAKSFSVPDVQNERHEALGKKRYSS